MSGQGTIYRPLTGGGDDVPNGWAIDQICYQMSQAVAVNGAVVTHEVVSADCVSGWDGSCPPTCGSSVGSTFNSIDPVILIGGERPSEAFVDHFHRGGTPPPGLHPCDFRVRFEAFVGGGPE